MLSFTAIVLEGTAVTISYVMLLIHSFVARKEFYRFPLASRFGTLARGQLKVIRMIMLASLVLEIYTSSSLFVTDFRASAVPASAYMGGLYMDDQRPEYILEEINEGSDGNMDRTLTMDLAKLLTPEEEYIGKYTFKKADDWKLAYGTSRLLSYYEFSEASFPLLYGKLLTAFGKPISTTADLEAAFDYVIIATDPSGKEHVLTAYYGATGSAIGGGDSPEDLEAARALEEYLKPAKLTDFEYEGYYFDSSLKVSIKLKDNICTQREWSIGEKEFEEAWEKLNP